MADIFNKTIRSQAGPLARSETIEIAIQGGGGPIGLAQSVQITYGQQLQRVYELGSFDTFMVSGRTQGSLQIARFIGLADGQQTLRQILGDQFFVVDGNTGGVLILRETNPGISVEYICSGCYVASASTGTDANGTVVTENISIEFQALEVSPK